VFEQYLKTIDEKAREICALADHMWDNPETSFQEFEASRILTEKLRENGFTVTTGVADMPTSFVATYGEGSPRLGILAEYDCVDGVSQVACSTQQENIAGLFKGHGCGHNLFAAGSLAAALAVKSYIEQTGKGSITLFGCPAEEGGGGKVFMARDGIFSNTDAIVSWHPECMYMVRTRPSLANVKVIYKFDGIAAHAGAAPHKGRSALDAVELMNIGTNFLREHMELTSRIHYAIIDAGGTAPNQVQAHAEVDYLIRAVDSESVRELQARVDRIAQGAAMMTDTKLTIDVHGGYSNLITIPTLQATANEAMHDIPLPMPTEEDVAYGKALQATMILSKEQQAQPPYAMQVLDPAPPVAHGGSTDTSDVSWNCPTVQMHIGNWVIGTGAHSWQAISQCRSDYAKRSMLYAGKAVAGTLLRLMENPALVEQAKKEHAEKIGDGYVCPIPKDLKPRL